VLVAGLDLELIEHADVDLHVKDFAGVEDDQKVAADQGEASCPQQMRALLSRHAHHGSVFEIHDSLVIKVDLDPTARPGCQVAGPV
jgi:hypothetical protein